MSEQLYRRVVRTDWHSGHWFDYEPVNCRYTREMLTHALRMACSRIKEPICPLDLAKQVDDVAFHEFMDAFECAERCDDNTARCWGAYFLETARTAEEEL